MHIPPAERERLAHAFDEASRFWYGAHLFLKVIESEDAPCMDWHTISIPVKELEKPDEVLRATVFHEFGHRTISPGSPEIAKAWQILVLNTLLDSRFYGYLTEPGTEVHHVIVNMVTDLWIDRYYLENELTASFYAAATAHNIAEAEKRMNSAIGAKGARLRTDVRANTDCTHGFKLFLLFLDLYRAILARSGGAPPAWKTDLGQKAFNILFGGTAGREDRLVEFTRLVKDIIPVSAEFVALILVNGKRVDQRTEAFPVDKATLIRILRSGGLKPGGPELKAVFGLKDGADLFALIKEMELYGRLIDTVEMVHRQGTRRRQFAGFTRWRVGHRLPDLLFERSLERYGRIIPNVNTLKKNFMVIGNADESRGMANICLIVDDSGSMSFEEVLSCLQESLFSLVLAAEKRQDPVSLIVFGSEVSHKQKPSFDYPLLKRAVASLEGGSGGTILAPAVREARRIAETVERQTTFLFTDTEVFDREADLKAELEGLASLSRIILFAFSDTEETAARFARRLPPREGFRAYYVRPGAHFYEASLKEVYHV